MDTLQQAGVPAGVCQTAEDRCEHDPQLRHLDWLVELRQSEIGTWPVREMPVQLSETPAYMGGMVDRHGPSYAEDNAYVFGELLGLSESDIRELAQSGVI
jgi:crotonobetainyl-CoA:carnitine CoA-transferase CaiB-like acyl-CoA transferase